MEIPARDRFSRSKVPEVTIYFWIIKVLCTTVGETAADFLSIDLHLGLTATSIVMSLLFAIAIAVQFAKRQYEPRIYWLTVVLISIVGTLITDNLTDKLEIPLETTTAVFSVGLALVFAVWYGFEKTLSIHSIVTPRRELFYWLAILLTFALGTAAGDLASEQLDFGYFGSGIVCTGLIALVSLVYYGIALTGSVNDRLFISANVWAFWLAYILTRPLGASIGDYLSQPPDNGGLGLGTTVTSATFLAAILATVVYLAVTKRDVIYEGLYG